MRINEIFYSLQGEGQFTGTPAVFVRLSGCNRKCSFCDTDFASYKEMTIAEILAEMTRCRTQAGAPAVCPMHAVITGGEPTLQIDEAFVDALHEEGYYVQIETNGSLPVPKNIDWVTCSPKERPWNIGRVDELKIVYQGQDVEEIASHFHPKTMRLQPCSGLNTPQTIAYVKAHPWWRLSLQTHKLISIP